MKTLIKHCDVAAQHLKPHRRGHMNEYFSFHLAALIIGRVEQFISHLEQKNQALFVSGHRPHGDKASFGFVDVQFDRILSWYGAR